MRWLRSDYQIAKGRLTKLPTVKTAKPEQFEALLRDATARKPGFPRDATDHTAAGAGDAGGAGAAGFMSRPRMAAICCGARPEVRSLI